MTENTELYYSNPQMAFYLAARMEFYSSNSLKKITKRAEHILKSNFST